MGVSKLFNFANLLTENAFHMVKTVDHSDNLSKGLDMINSLDIMVQESTRELYDALLEAESKKDENACFGQYYNDYKKALMKFESEMRELAGGFSINIETFIDANLSVLDKCCCCPPNSTYHGAQFTNLLSNDIPNIDPYKAFKKEWALLGRLLQDLDPSAPEVERTKIITTVYNSLSKEINDGWLDKCVEKIADCDDCSKDNFAKIIYDKFVTSGEVDIALDIPTVEQAKLSLKNYTNYTDCICKSADDFCDGISKIACDLGSMLFRNMDKKLEIKTDEEGVADATYRLNDYSMNQVNAFLATKVSQIRELTNLYTIALTIKMDCIFKYLKQCVAIIEASCMSAASLNNAPETSEEPETPEGELDDETPSPEDNTETPEEPEGDDETPEDGGEEVPNPEDEPDGIENNTPVADEKEGEEPIEDDVDSSEEVEEPTEESYISALEKACYLAEANAALLRRYTSYKDLNREYIKEDGEPTPAAAPSNGTETNGTDQPLETPEEAAGNRGKSLLQKIKDLSNSAKDSRSGSFATQIKFCKDHKNAIMSAKIPDNWTIQQYNLSSFGSFKLVPFSMADKDLYKDKNAFLKAKYGKYGVVGNGKKENTIDFFLRKVYSDKEIKYTDKERVAGFNYITSDYDSLFQNLLKMSDEFCNFYNKEYEIMQKHVEEEKKQKKATKESTMVEYFKEDFTGVDEASGDKNISWRERWTIVNDWFNVTLAVYTAYCNIITRNFKKQYAFLKKLESISGRK